MCPNAAIQMSSEIQLLTQALRSFSRERDWEKFHSPKNLAMALAVEAAELLEHFQWMTEDESKTQIPETAAEIAAEAADVFLYLLQLADKLGIDLVDEARAKMQTNALKYPVDLAKGSRTKYNKL
ncbi:nucleotide pyrophosphohydrolase [soil metagenome]